MPARKRPTAEDRVEATRIALRGIALGADLPDVVRELEPLHPKNDTFPGEVLLELAADALGQGGISREQPVDYEGIRERYLPEQQFRGKAQHHRSHYALRAVTMIRAGVTPDLLNEVSWWDTNDLWIWSLYALVIYVRVAAERTGQSAAEICQRVATRHGIGSPGREADRPATNNTGLEAQRTFTMRQPPAAPDRHVGRHGARPIAVIAVQGFVVDVIGMFVCRVDWRWLPAGGCRPDGCNVRIH